jgi:uncharacterized protein YjiS (DUF1127 family)
MAHVMNFPAAAKSQDSTVGFFGAFTKAIADYRLYLRTVAELKSLSGRELQDLGLSRYSIHEVARDAVYGR